MGSNSPHAVHPLIQAGLLSRGMARHRSLEEWLGIALSRNGSASPSRGMARHRSSRPLAELKKATRDYHVSRNHHFVYLKYSQNTPPSGIFLVFRYHNCRREFCTSCSHRACPISSLKNTPESQCME
jgi:hypothetical protein